MRERGSVRTGVGHRHLCGQDQHDRPGTNRLSGPNITIGGQPCGIVAGGNSLWVNGYGTNSVDRVDPARRKLVDRIAVGAQPYDVAFGYGSVWTTNNGDGTVDRIDPATDKVVRSYDTKSTPTGLSITGGYVWVGANSGSQIFRIDPLRTDSHGSMCTTRARRGLPLMPRTSGWHRTSTTSSSTSIREPGRCSLRSRSG